MTSDDNSWGKLPKFTDYIPVDEIELVPWQKYKEDLERQLAEANKKLEVANTYLGVIKQYRYNPQFIEEAVDQALAQLTDKREKEGLE